MQKQNMKVFQFKANIYIKSAGKPVSEALLPFHKRLLVFTVFQAIVQNQNWSSNNDVWYFKVVLGIFLHH